MNQPASGQLPGNVTAIQRDREQRIVDQVIASFANTSNDRLRELMQAMVTHLHAFLRDVRLTEDEWRTGIDFLTATGHTTNDRRQEFILLSDTLGASMQTIAINNQADADATEATVFGPFFVEHSPRIALGGDITGQAHGEPCWVEGTVRDTNGNPISGARIEVWEADADGYYDVQYDDDRVGGRAHLYTGKNGEYRFWAVTPTPYPIPHDGPVGQMLQVTSRSPMRASHLHFMVTAPGHRRLVTHIFVNGDPYLDNDSVFGVKDSLVKCFTPQRQGATTPDGRELGGQAWTRSHFDIVLSQRE